jgi:hypothetical protein
MQADGSTRVVTIVRSPRDARLGLDFAACNKQRYLCTLLHGPSDMIGTGIMQVTVELFRCLLFVGEVIEIEFGWKVFRWDVWILIG